MSLVRTFTHLAGQPHAPEALHTLKRIADLVHPIMKRYGWILPILSEFFPDDAMLLGLNVNAGAKILVRLRPARSPGTFYPIEQLVRVMLHELTHNVHGPHDERFYSFLNKLEDEYDALVIGGWRGTGFFSPGDKVGGRVEWWGLGRQSGEFDTAGKRKALEAAEARRRAEALGSGGRLGGSRVAAQSGKTRQQLAAEAAERRRTDEQSCAASHPSADREASRAAADSITDIVADDDLVEALALSSAMASSAAQAQVARPPTAYPSGSRAQRFDDHGAENDVIDIDSDSDSNAGSQFPPDSREQRCPVCTYLNSAPQHTERCAMCNVRLPETSVPSDMSWTCAVCTLENGSQAQSCEACNFPKERRDWAPKRRGRMDEDASVLTNSALSTWTCKLCTLVNVHASRVCSICEAPCPLTVPRSSGPTEPGRAPNQDKAVRLEKAEITAPPSWDCHQCGRQGIAHEFWMCGACGWIKKHSDIGRY